MFADMQRTQTPAIVVRVLYQSISMIFDSQIESVDETENDWHTKTSQTLQIPKIQNDVTVTRIHDAQAGWFQGDKMMRRMGVSMSMLPEGTITLPQWGQ